MEARELQASIEAGAGQAPLGAGGEIMEIQKIGEHVRCDQQGGVALGRRHGVERPRLLQQGLDQLGLAL